MPAVGNGVFPLIPNIKLTCKLARYLSQPEIGKRFAIEGSILPVYSSLYEDKEVLKAVPWLADAQAVVKSAKVRPIHARYGEIFDLIRIANQCGISRYANCGTNGRHDQCGSASYCALISGEQRLLLPFL